MIQNGFQNNRNNDYQNQELGIILEDLHDENVLTRNEVLYFIDTVFYLTENFWGK
jgi:Ser/Thr protein kinase RdoA (MazF antagonist)